jgi:hypothetical protein
MDATMTMTRKRSQATSRDGINFVRTIVERHNSTFQEIDLHNDLGNDAYVEFVVEENATGCCVALQIKSGRSYRVAPHKCAFQSDRDHFEYWVSHTLPVLAVVFDPDAQKAFWVDITEHLRQHPSLITEGPYTVSAEQELSDTTFHEFRRHCLCYRDPYSREQNFARALDSFSVREDVEKCFDGLRALFAYHRQQTATWYYLISCLSNYKEHPILPALIVDLCHVPGHGDIFWSKGNLIEEQVRRKALLFMRERFDRRDALTLLSSIDDAGIQRGTIGQCVHALVDTLADREETMESIAIDQGQSERIRHSAILFAVDAAQSKSGEQAIRLLDRITPAIQNEELADVVSWLKRELLQFGFVSFY